MEPASAIPAFAEMEVAKKQLAENEEKFRNVLLQSPSIFLILKGPELVIDFVNEPLLRSWNKNWDIVGKTLDEALPEIKNQPFPKLLKQDVDLGAFVRSVTRASNFSLLCFIASSALFYFGDIPCGTCNRFYIALFI